MATKHDLQRWVEEALVVFGGAATVVDVARQIWQDHESELRESGDLFFTWQYDMRWAAQALRDSGRARPSSETKRGYWDLVD